MKLHPCLAEPILALHPHELTPPLSPDPVFGCFHLSPQPRMTAVEHQAALQGLTQRTTRRPCGQGTGRGHSAASHLAEATVAAVTSDDPEADPEAVPVPQEGVAVYVAPNTQR